MTSIALPRRLPRPVLSPPSLRAALIGFLVTLVTGLLLLGGVATALGLTTGPGALPNVSVGGVPLSGLDRAAAEQRLVEQLPSLRAGSATIGVDGEEFVVGYAEVGRGYEMDAMLDSAFAVGRTGSPLADGVARIRAMIHPTALPVIVHAFDPVALDGAVDAIARDGHLPAVEARVTRSATVFRVSPSAEGRALDGDALRSALAAALATADPADVRIDLAPIRLSPRVDTATAVAAAEAARATAAHLELTVPGMTGDEAPIRLAASTIAGWISFGPVDGSVYAVRIDERAVGAAVEALTDEVDRDPVNARITVAGSGLGGVVPGQAGRVLDVEASTSALLATLTDRGRGIPNGSLALAVDETEPALTTAEAEAALPQMRMVSTWTTTYIVNEGNGFGSNISIPAWDLDGFNLAPGEWFSFWGGIGPVTLERGYRYGGAIINGRSVAQGALAGGICSTSTTLFNAAMRFGLEIGERTAHYYYIDRYPTGLDATVAIVNDSVVDMTFRNDTDHPIVIRGFGTPGQVTFQLWSVPNGRTVALSDPVITDRRSAIETTQLDTSLAPGTSRRVEFPHHGFNATVHRTVYGPAGEVVHQNSWYSPYRAVNGITLVGPTPAAPAPADPPGEDEA
jgi:vancomycin resistance protein YoaR